jgi:RHS repeat-associated protein
MSSSFRSFYRWFAVIVSFCLIISLVGPGFTEAAPGEAERGPKKENLNADIGELPNKLPKEKLELTNKRTPFSTRYLNPDGSFTEEIFMEQQFYQDPSDKKWKKIDNKLKNSTKKAGKFENTANDQKVWFTQETGNGELVTVEKNEKTISFVPVKAKKVKGTVKNNEVNYKGIFDNVDVHYRVQGSAVKEDIILNQYQNENTFSFELKMKGVTPHKEKNGTIIFKDSKGKQVWFFELPFMTDAKGKYSDNVSFELRKENGKTFVDVIADQAFLEDPETQYPVTIDPTINSWDVLRDNFIASSFPDSIFSSNTYMHTGYNSYFGTTRALVEFYLPSLPSDSKISSANFNAYQTKSDTTNTTIDLYRTSNWSSSVTWNTQPTIGSKVEGSTTNNTANTYWQWDITQLVKDWYNGDQANYGFMLKQQNETTSPYRTFNSVNSGNNTPRLTVNYTVDPIGQEEFWSVTEEGINPANGNLFVSDTDISTPGRGPESSITRSYNSRKSWFAGMFGYGWITNLEARLVDAGKGPITLIDGDNTRHIFGQAIGGGYDTPGGLYLTLAKNQDGTYTITEKDGTKVNFNTSGKISSIVDTNGNTLNFTYDTGGKLTVIKDASGRSTTIAYGTNGFVSSVTDPANRTTIYNYDTAGNLTKITDPAGNSTTLSYDTDHNIKSTTDARSITTTVNYDTSDRVQSVSRPITISGVKETSTTTFSYNSMVTSVTDGEGKRVDYSYNPNGNITKINENPLDAQNNAVTQFCYDDFNNLTKVIDANLYKADSGNTCDATTAKPAYVYSYDENGNLTGAQLPGTSDNPATPGAPVNETYTYDAANNLVEEQDYNKNIDNIDYDSKNNPTESIDPYQQSVSQRYFANGNLQYVTHPMSVTDNQLFNASYEMDENADNWPDRWTKFMKDGTTANFGWSTTKKFGKKAISISNPTGWAIVSSEKIKYVAGDQYIASAFIKTENTTNTALIKIEYLDAQGTPLEPTTFSYGLKGTHDWTRVQAVLSDVPSTTDTIRISVGMNPGSGTAYFDGVQLEKGSVLGAYNLVENSSFEQLDSNGKPYLWDGSDLSTNDGLDNTEAYVGKYSYKLTGEAGINKSIKQSIPISGDQNTRLTLSGWSKQVGADPNGGYYNLQVAINYTDGTVGWNNANDFNTTVTDWQHVSAEVKATKAFNSIDVHYYYWNQKGTAWFDAMRLELGASHTANTYDASGNYVTSIKNPLGDTVSYQYDTAGNQTSITDGKGQKTSYAFDTRNLLTNVTDTNLGVTQYGYDAIGNRTTVTDAKNNLTKYEYNEFDVVSQIINPLNQVTKFEYNKNGDQTKVTYPNGSTVSNTFNALNRLEKVLYNGIEKWSYGYDANGNITSVTDGSGKSTTYTYDKNKKVTGKSEGASNKVVYSYDDNGNTTALTATAGTTQFTNGFTYNKLDQLIAMSRSNSNIVRFVYDERGNVISEKRANSTYSAYEYDSNNRLQSVINYNASGSIIDKFIYTYDANGNWTGIATKDGNLSYQYDTLNRLTKEILKDGTNISYEYDKVGNRTKKVETKETTSTTTSYTYDTANQLTNNNGVSQTYDTNGNLTNNGDKTFIYNEDNRLIEVKDKNGASVATFTYDDQGLRKSMTTSSGTVYFYYDGDKVIYETDGNNNILAEYTWDQEGNPVTMSKDGKTYYYHLNGHSDVIALTDASGVIVADYQYDAWGNILSQTGTMASSNPYRYSSYRYDEGTGLYYLKARYYDANTGRFITRDTFHGFEDDPKSLNQYAYAHGNPVRYVDHEGNWVWLVFNAALATYDGYKAYKKAKAEGKRGYKLAAAVAWAVAGNFIKVGKISKYLRLITKGHTKLTYSGLKKIGTASKSKGIRIVKGNSIDAYKFFRAQVVSMKKIKPGMYIGKDANGVTFTYRRASKSGPPTIDVNGVNGLRKIKFTR